MAKTFRDAFLAHLERTGTPVKRVAEEAGVSYEQLKKLKGREGSSTNVEDAVKIARYFGYSLDEFIEDRTVQDRAEIVSLYNQLTPRERAILRAAGSADRDPALEG
ncbi:helix-turn-helix domain-containing protein [Limimaricola hongkongensis]|uniref:Putative phage repressor n=1 Tax=Limimaricola hongkongensis DSM 17492 TaxID=1122180 RepID=A0A017HBM6_9RHOB|nr:helix-turn-helix transcriptional regulator [Limimaricola hongkongensis]EYD71781.1 putative phage repressor [Limimaricola hongkongensis DSM 17492]